MKQTLNEYTVANAKCLTDNSSVIAQKPVLAAPDSREEHSHAERAKIIESTVAMWNKFGNDTGSIVDQYSTL